MNACPNGYSPTSSYGYKTKGCRCAQCTASAREYNKALRLRHRFGDPSRVDSKIVSDHIKRLNAAGIGSPYMQALCGVSQSTIRSIKHRERASVNFDTAEKILAITPEDKPPHAKVPAWKVQVLIAELKAAGIERDELIEALKYNHAFSFNWLYGPERVSQRTLDRVSFLYRYYATKGRCPMEPLERVQQQPRRRVTRRA